MFAGRGRARPAPLKSLSTTSCDADPHVAAPSGRAHIYSGAPMAARGQRKARNPQGRDSGPARSTAPASDGQILALLTEGHKAHLAGDVDFAEQRYRQVL